MRWNAAHVGNIRQAPEEDQEAVNPDLKVPDEQNPLVEDEELEPAPTRRDADPKDAPKAQKDEPKDDPKAPSPAHQGAASSSTAPKH